MAPNLYKLDITLHEATFFASHELHDQYFTEPLIGNYALVYALGLVKSPYNRYHVGYGEDLPLMNQKGIYATPAWPETKPRYRIERFNCQGESFFMAMSENAVVELAGRQYKKDKHIFTGESGKRIRPTNRPQIGILKLLCPLNHFSCHLISREELSLPIYIRLGKFMSKAKIDCRKIELYEKIYACSEYKLINPIDLEPGTKILFGDTINIHPTPLIRKADIEGLWWADRDGKPVVPANMEFRGIDE